MKKFKFILLILCCLAVAEASAVIVRAYPSSNAGAGLYQDGYDDGYERGVINGRVEGREAGYNSGYEKGYADGEAAGYDAGHSDGVLAGRSEMQTESTAMQESEVKDRVTTAVCFTAAGVCAVFVLILRFISGLIKRDNARLQKKYQSEIDILQRRLEAEQRKNGTSVEQDPMRPAVPAKSKNYEEIRRLKEEIAKTERGWAGFQKSNRENMKLLAEAFTDEELARMVRRGELSAAHAEEYKEQRRCAEMLIAYAPSFRESIEKMLAEMRQELAELEADH